MQVEKISKTNLRKTRNQNIRNEDLTSFGMQDRPSLNIDEKKSSDAIKCNFLSNVSFKGHGETISYHTVGTSGTISMTDSIKGEEKGAYWNCDSAIKGSSSYHKSSSIKKLKDSTEFYPNYIGDSKKVYFLDPEETATYKIQNDYDYLVYDNQPKFPKLEDLKDNIYTKDKYVYTSEFENGFKDVAEYYDRLEEVDRKELYELMKKKNVLDTSLDYRNSSENKLKKFPWKVDRLEKDFENAKYFANENSAKLSGIDTKVDFYKQRIDDSIYKQDKAIEAYKIFNEASNVINDRAQLISNSRDIAERLKNGPEVANLTKGQSYYDSYGNNKYEKKYIEIFKTQKSKLDESLQISENWYKMQKTEMNEKIDKIEKESENSIYKRNLETKEKEKETIRSEYDIAKIENKLKQLKSEIESTNEKIVKYEKIFEERKAEFKRDKDLLPIIKQQIADATQKIKDLYPKMEAFYRNNIDEFGNIVRHLK